MPKFLEIPYTLTEYDGTRDPNKKVEQVDNMLNYYMPKEP